MAKQIAVPCLFMRGGTSRGPYFNRHHLPSDLDKLSKVLVAAVGAGHKLNINGIGGGVAVTTKVAMLSPSTHADADVDYFFAQVNVEDENVDFSPTCGNILSGVGPAAIEMGLIAPTPDETRVRIHAVNTGALIDAIVQTPFDPVPRVEYEGDTMINGVPGTAAPVHLNFKGIVGSKTGALFPTGQAKERIDGINVTLIDVAVPMLMVSAEELGKTGHESMEALNEDENFMSKLEGLRLQAGLRMGLGDVTDKVIPKVGLLSKPEGEACANVRYFMPWHCHPSLAVTGSMAFAACILAPGTVSDDIEQLEKGANSLLFEHPMGNMRVAVDYDVGEQGLELHSAGTVRTARLLMRGEIMIPSSAF